MSIMGKLILIYYYYYYTYKPNALIPLIQEGEDIFSLYHKSMDGDDSSDPYQPSSGRLVEILREENASLKQELESYYQKVRRLQKVRRSMMLY